MSSSSHWERLYNTHDAAAVSWYQSIPALSLDWIAEVAPPATDPTILDVGAGASTLVDHLLARGYRRVTLLEVAPSALEQVRLRLGERAKGVQWITTDLLEFGAHDNYDVWHDRAVLHFLRDQHEQRRYSDLLSASVRPGGHAIIATFAVGGPTRCSGLEIVQYDSTRLMDLVGPDFTLVREQQELHRTPSGGEQLFAYFLLEKRTEKSHSQGQPER